jgi:hypothetical protein
MPFAPVRLSACQHTDPLVQARRRWSNIERGVGSDLQAYGSPECSAAHAFDYRFISCSDSYWPTMDAADCSTATSMCERIVVAGHKQVARIFFTL